MPATSRERVDIASINEAIYIRVIGLGNAAKSIALRDVAESLISRGGRRLVVDFGHARGLDSTFMGTLLALAGLAMEWIDAERNTESDCTCGNPNCAAMILTNVPAHVHMQLDTLGLLGVEPLLKVIDAPIQFPECLMNPLPEINSTHTRRLDVIREAHERLVQLNADNEQRFGPFLRAMISEMDARQQRDQHFA